MISDTSENDSARLEDEARATALVALEFPSVRVQLALHTSFAPAREEALKLVPLWERREVAELQQETSDARHFLEGNGKFDLSETVDLRGFLDRVVRDGVLDGVELRQIYETLRHSRLAAAALQRRGSALPCLSNLVKQIPDLVVLENDIGLCIGRTGYMEDAASTTLKQARFRADTNYKRLNHALVRLIESDIGRTALQEQLITERNGRFVVPVKIGMRRRVPGLVHDVSDSGSTLFVEPLSVVSIANQWHQAKILCIREEQKVLRRLSLSVRGHDTDLELVTKLMIRLDLAMARGRYGSALNAVTPEPIDGDPPYLWLEEARHPLLSGKAVPMSLGLGNHSNKQNGWTTLLITGPNAGGKTVALKTIGLMCLMYQSGLQVPAAEGTKLPVWGGIFASIGDHQALDTGLSTFSSQIASIQNVIQVMRPDTLVLLDELGSSTDPDEGAALAKAILLQFTEHAIPFVATTHHLDLAVMVQDLDGAMNASVDLDPVNLQPTYTVTLGGSGRSYALSIAEQVGLSSLILDKARGFLSPAYNRVVALHGWLRRERSFVSSLREEAQEALEQIAQKEAALDKERDQMETQLSMERARLKESVDESIGELQIRVARIERARRPQHVVTAQPRDLAESQAMASHIAQLHKKLNSRIRQPSVNRAEQLRSLCVGDTVEVRGLPGLVQVIKLLDASGRIEVIAGTSRVQVTQENVLLIPAKSPHTSSDRVRQTPTNSLSSRITSEESRKSQRETAQLDLRGIKAQEAMILLEEFIESTLLRGSRDQVWVLHGVGSGALRRAVREYLKRHGSTLYWECSGEGRDDTGTLVTLR
jgi:DNA mismatch repair protein MutS2